MPLIIAHHGKAIFSLVVALYSAQVFAESVYVKYRGPVELAPFHCESITRSSFINRLCYDNKEKYAIVSLNGTYYHYCEVPQEVISSWHQASSMGQFYNRYVKGSYDCRINYLPKY